MKKKCLISASLPLAGRHAPQQPSGGGGARRDSAVSQSAQKDEEQKEGQEQGPGRGRKGQGPPAEAVPDPRLVVGDLQEDGRGLALLAARAPAHHSHQVPRAV